MNTLLVISHIICLGAIVVSSSTRNLGRITGGTDAFRSEAPYIVALSNGTIFCAGSIIHVNWVLTSAQCLRDEGFEIIAGLPKTNPNYGAWNVQRRKVLDESYFVRYEYFYDDELGSYDVGLVFVSEPFEFGVANHVNSVLLPPKVFDKIPEGPSKLYGYGYGNYGLIPENLQVLDTYVISLEECKQIFEPDVTLMFYNICTDGSLGICLYDSGAPLVRSTPKGMELIGVASWGESPCDSRISPSVYTRVDLLIEWISNTIKTYKHLDKCQM